MSKAAAEKSDRLIRQDDGNLEPRVYRRADLVLILLLVLFAGAYDLGCG